jgi:hypothetical protein
VVRELAPPPLQQGNDRKTSRPDLQERISLVDEKLARAKLSYHAQFRKAPEEEKTLLLNVERFLLALPYKKQWEIEKEEAQSIVQEQETKIQQLFRSLGDLQDQLKYTMAAKNSTEQQLAQAKADLDYAWNKLVPVRTEI